MNNRRDLIYAAITLGLGLSLTYDAYAGSTASTLTSLFQAQATAHDLIEAAQNGETTEVHELLTRAHINVNIRDEHGTTALIAAALNGQVPVVRLLIDAGADLDIQSPYTALISAVSHGHNEAAYWLIKAGAQVNIPEKAGSTAGYTPLLWATITKNYELVAMLLDAGAMVNSADKNGYTPLMIASASGQKAIVKLLLRAHASLTMQTQDGKTAREIAQENHHNEVVALLESHQRYLDQEDEIMVKPAV